MPIVGKDLLRAFWRLLFYLHFCKSSNQWKSTQYQKFYFKFERYFYIKIIVSVIPTDLVINSLLSSFCYKPKTTIKFPKSWWSGNNKYFCFLFIASRVLLQSHAEFNDIYYMLFLCVIVPWYMWHNDTNRLL